MGGNLGIYFRLSSGIVKYSHLDYYQIISAVLD